jgi:hypothetical protein
MEKQLRVYIENSVIGGYFDTAKVLGKPKGRVQSPRNKNASGGNIDGEYSQNSRLC